MLNIRSHAWAPEALPTGVPARTAAAWIFSFVVWGILRHKLEQGPLGPYGADLFNRISVLEVAEVYLIVRLISSLPREVMLSKKAAFLTLGIVATVVLLLRYRPSYASGGLEILFLGLSIVYPQLRILAIAVTLFVFQYVFLAGPFLWLHELVGRLDAAVLRSLLTESGIPADGYGPIVVVKGSSHGINVMGACSSSNVLATVGTGYLIVVLGLRGRFVANDVLWATALVTGTIVLNWLRLMPMALSKEGHAFWHDGFGASLVSLAYAGVVAAAAFMATRASPAGSASPSGSASAA